MNPRTKRPEHVDGAEVWLWSRPSEIGLEASGIIDYGHYGKDAAEAYTQVLSRKIKERQSREPKKQPSADAVEAN